MHKLTIAEAAGASIIWSLPTKQHQDLMNYLDNDETWDFNEADPNSDREDG